MMKYTLVGRLRTLAVLLIFCLISGSICQAQNKPAHHKKNGYRNIHEKEANTFLDFLKWRFDRIGKDIPGPDSYTFPLAQNDPEFLRHNRSQNTVTWIGHATLFLQLEGKNILTDPIFSHRASPVQWSGPQRVVPPGVSLQDLPAVDVVLISHDHYDSLDKTTIEILAKRQGGQETLFCVPLGLGKWVRERGAHRVLELDWWEEREIKGLRIIATPINHWSKRSLFGRNQTLWASWVLLAEKFRFYFAGDTGYSPIFKEIGNRYGPFDLAAIPIGAYEPRWFMAKHHVNPEEAVKIHQDVGAKLSVAIHWGTFMLTDEPLDEPPERLKKALADQNFPDEKFRILQHGQTIILE